MREWVPLIQVYETILQIIVLIETPGVDRSSLHLKFMGNKIVLSGEKRKMDLSDIVKERNEIGYGKFSRTITIPLAITNRESINTSYTNGLLKIDISKETENLSHFDIKL